MAALPLSTPPGSVLGKLQGLKPVALKLELASESPGGRVKTKMLDPTPRDPDSVGLGSSPGICTSDKPPGDDDVTLHAPHS